MTQKSSVDAPADFLKFSQAQIEAAMEIQKEVLEAYEQISLEWLERVKWEAKLWSELAASMSAAKSVPDAMAAVPNCATQRMRMAAEDGRRILSDSQKMANAVTRGMAHGPSVGTK